MRTPALFIFLLETKKSERLRTRVRSCVDPAAGRMGGVGELAEQAGDDERDLLADVDGVVADPLEGAGDEDHVHRPLARVGVVAADVEGHPEDLAVEAIDLAILTNEILGEADVAPPKAAFDWTTSERA